MSLCIADIENIDGTDIDSDTKSIITIFLNSVNDWPNAVLSLEQYVAELEDFINAKTSKTNLNDALKKIDLKTNAWEAESISQILEVYFCYSEYGTLNEIIIDLKSKIEN